MVPVTVGGPGCVTKNFGKWLEKLGITVRIDILLKTVKQGTKRILRKVLRPKNREELTGNWS